MTLRELVDWITLQGEIVIRIYDSNMGDYTIQKRFHDVDSGHELAEYFEYYVKYMYTYMDADTAVMAIEVSEEKY